MKRDKLPVVCLLLAALAGPARSDDTRHVPLDGQPNFRDLGGYKTEDGETVKRGLVFRSGELPRLTDKDIEKLEQLGIKTVVNFLTEIETKSRGKDRLPDNEIDMTNVKAFYILEGRYIDTTRDEILAKYGSIDGYLTKGLGVTKREIQSLHDRLLK